MMTKILIVVAGLCALVEQTVQHQCYVCTQCAINTDSKYEKKTCDESEEACFTKVKSTGELAKTCAAVYNPLPEHMTGYTLYYCRGDLCNGLAHNKDILNITDAVSGDSPKGLTKRSSMSPLQASESSCRSWVINSGYYKLLHVTFLIYIIHF